MNWTNQLPPSLHPWLDEFAALASPCIRLRISDSVADSPIGSCIGSTPYWPKNKRWPSDDSGRPLFGLLQINLSEFPPLLNWPTEGILQLFITDSIFWGADPDTPSNQANFRLVFHESAAVEKTDLLDDFSFLPDFEELPWKNKKSLKLTGEAEEMLMPFGHADFPETLKTVFESFGDEKWELINEYQKAIGAAGHRLGGYPFFMQDDPRQQNALHQKLLLQLDSEPKFDLMWGDFGTAHWFTESSSANRSLDDKKETSLFSKPTYFWESN